MRTSPPAARGRDRLDDLSPADDSPLVFARAAWRKVRAHARAAYPDEACGFLLSTCVGSEGGGRAPVVESRPAENEHSGDRRRGFVISATALAAAEALAVGRGTFVSGFYHSHPNRPSVPSRQDARNAWPGFVHVIVPSGRSSAHERPRAYVFDPALAALRAIPLGLADLPREE